MSDAARAPRYRAITRRSRLAPWRIYRIVQVWNDFLRCWIEVNRTRWFR